MKPGSSTTWIALLLTLIIGLGIGLRFINLDRKVYWFDEVYTTFRAAGYTSQEIDQAIFQNQLVSPADLQRFQQIKPDSTVRDTLNSLKTEDPQHPPLYFILTRGWMQRLGSSPTVTRSLPALISLLSLPALYFLGQELFQSRLVALVGVALLAVSPIDILFAQTARQYSLLTLAVIASSWLLMRSLRLRSVSSWFGYSLAITVGFYSHPLFVLTLVAQGLYSLQRSIKRIPAPPPSSGLALSVDRFTLMATAGAMLLGGLLYSPWVAVLITNYQRATATTSWTKSQVDGLALLQRWVLNVTALVVDTNAGVDDPVNYGLRLPVIGLLLAAFYVLLRRTPPKTWGLIVLLTGVPFLLLALPDLLLGGKRSTVTRYVIPCFPGVQLALAYLLAQLLIWGRGAGRLLAVSVWVAALISVTANLLAPTWWSKSISYFNGQMADAINATPAPIVISDRGDNYLNKGQLISISNRLQDDVQLLLLSHPPDLTVIPAVIPADTQPLVYFPSTELKDALQAQGWILEPVAPLDGLWQAQRETTS